VAEEGGTGTTEEATAGAVEAAAEGAAARRTGPAADVAATRGSRRRVRGEVVELAAARQSTPPSGGPRPRLRRGRLRPRIRRRRVRRDPLVIASPDLLARNRAACYIALFLVFRIFLRFCCVILCFLSLSVSAFSTVVDGRVITAYQFFIVAYIVVAIFTVCPLICAHYVD
jgi:hypothetical protein